MVQQGNPFCLRAAEALRAPGPLPRHLVAIRTDGGEALGLGNVMRCISLADALDALGVRPLFLCADAQPSGLIVAHGYDVCVLETSCRELQAEMPLLEQVLSVFRTAFVYVDSLFVSAPYLEGIRRTCKVGFVGNGLKVDAEVDLLLNYSPSADLERLAARFGSGRTKLLTGSQHALLRREFWEAGFIEIRERVQRLLLCVGGTDDANLCDALLEAFGTVGGLDGVERHVVVGPYFRHAAGLQSKWGRTSASGCIRTSGAWPPSSDPSTLPWPPPAPPSTS